MSAEIIAGLLDDMEEDFRLFSCVELYLLGWSLRKGAPMTDQMRALARQAYDEFTSRHATRVVWTRWPTDPDNTWPLGPDDELEFDLDPDGPPNGPLQILVPE